MSSTRKIVLYIAISLDGYIARDNGDIDWLSMVESPDEDYGYKDFLKSIDTVIMGRRTYDQVLTFGDFPYKDKKCFVISRTEQPKDDHVEFFKGDMSRLIFEIRQNDGKDIWLIGGGASSKGIMLFNRDLPEIRLRLCRNIAFPSGLIQLFYERSD